MAEFRCINCGAMKESEEICSCPDCGYRMFETPYDRRAILTSEIKRFIESLEVKNILRKDLVFLEKDKDDRRFPNYDRILKYVSGSERTETFLANLLATVEQLKKHYTTEFSNTYKISFEQVDDKLKKYDEVLLEAIQKVFSDGSSELSAVEWEEASLLYSETQNRYLWSSANELLGLIEKLAKKIARFIKMNNLYGRHHQYHPSKRTKELEKITEFKDALEEQISETETIIYKQYIVDIDDDGGEELREMLTCLWHGIELIMTAPLFIKDYEYLIGSARLSEKVFFERISEKLTKRYTAIDVDTGMEAFLNDKSEEELFDIYKNLISIDKFGILVPTGTKLINIGEGEKKLERMIGLSGIKESIRKIKAYVLANKDSEDLNIHMCFLGNPGSGKTEVARCIADILYENKILPTNKIVEVDRSGLVSEYFGATAEKTKWVIKSAMGGVLFIDEAYALGNNSSDNITDYGKEAIDTLVKAMEDYRGQFCVILAGYRNETLQMLSLNPGFKSRIQFTLDFPNYDRNELKSITELMLNTRHYTIGESAMSKILDITDVKRKEPNFANAREIRNILDQIIMNQNLRRESAEDHELGLVDVNKYIQDAKIKLPVSGVDTNQKILTGEEELDQLIGLSSLKRMVRKIKAYAKRNKDEADFNLHMCFYGNPGTGKTEVARIISRILYDAGVLDEAKLVETDGQGLIGQYVGDTAPKTKAKINEAMGGVLFIDEAYSLMDAGKAMGGSSYGDEAVSVLLKEMEDHRGQFCAILAGYKDEMKRLLNANPGFESRIQFTLEFPDYTREELGEIAKAFLLKKRYDIEEPALEKILDITDYFRKQPNFANARTVRNILDQVIMNQNLRTEDEGDEEKIILQDVEEYLTDERIDLGKSTVKRFGFGV